MSAPRLCWRYPSDYGVLTAGSADTEHPASNLQLPQLAEQWTSGASATAEWLKVDLGSATAVSAMALLDHDLDGTETALVLEANDTDAWGTPAYSLTVTARTGSLIEFFAEQTYRWWRLSITKASATDVRSAGRWVLGPSYTFERRPSRRDLRWGYEEASTVTVVPSGQAYADRAARLRTLELSVDLAPQTQADEFEALYRYLGETEPFVVALDPENYPTEWLLYGRLRRRYAQQYRRWVGAAPSWRLGLDLVEAR